MTRTTRKAESAKLKIFFELPMISSFLYYGHLETQRPENCHLTYICDSLYHVKDAMLHVIAKMRCSRDLMNLRNLQKFHCLIIHSRSIQNALLLFFICFLVESLIDQQLDRINDLISHI